MRVHFLSKFSNLTDPCCEIDMTLLFYLSNELLVVTCSCFTVDVKLKINYSTDFLLNILASHDDART